jgi:hypothetical protein
MNSMMPYLFSRSGQRAAGRIELDLENKDFEVNIITDKKRGFDFIFCKGLLLAALFYTQVFFILFAFATPDPTCISRELKVFD